MTDAQASGMTIPGVGSSAWLGSDFIFDFMTIHKNVMANWDNTGDHPRDVVFYSDFIQLERENARLRAALRLAIHVRGTSEDTVEVLQAMESALLPNVQDEP